MVAQGCLSQHRQARSCLLKPLARCTRLRLTIIMRTVPANAQLPGERGCTGAEHSRVHPAVEHHVHQSQPVGGERRARTHNVLRRLEKILPLDVHSPSQHAPCVQSNRSKVPLTKAVGCSGKTELQFVELSPRVARTMRHTRVVGNTRRDRGRRRDEQRLKTMEGEVVAPRLHRGLGTWHAASACPKNRESRESRETAVNP
jgi:hypothetical protein